MKSSRRQQSTAETLYCFSPVVPGYVGLFAFCGFRYLITRSHYFSLPPRRSAGLEFTARLDDFSFSSLRHVFASVIYMGAVTGELRRNTRKRLIISATCLLLCYLYFFPFEKPRVFAVSNGRIYARFRLIGPSAPVRLGDTRTPKKGYGTVIKNDKR